MPLQIPLSRKQLLTLQLLDNPEIVDLLLGGGAGGAKSLTICLWMFFQCRNYPGIRIGLGRKELTRLKETTVVTLLREVHPLLGVKEHQFKYNEQKGRISYVNGSSILLVDLAWQPSDPEFDRFGSLNLTHAVVEEAGEVMKKARDIFISRKNRFMNKKYHLVGKSITTCNPSQNFLKNEYYKPFMKAGGGGHQIWEYGKVEVEGEMKTAYRAFIKSLATDNPFLPRNYIEVLRKLPDAERKRLLEGNWDFADNDKMLFPSQRIDRALVKSLPSGKKAIGVDVSDAGDDKTIISLVEQGVLAEQEAIEVDKSKPIGEQIALAIIKFAQQRGFSAAMSRDIGVDTLGVGTSTRDFMKSKGWPVREFIAGASSEGNFKNLRGETIYGLSQALDTGVFSIYERLPTLDILREQLMAHEYTTEERTIVVTPKKIIKEVLGVSPDYAESAYIAFWVAQGDNDPRQNQNRVSF